jgi:hypothetical protein
LYGLLATGFSHYAKRWIGQAGWRDLHYVSFPLCAGVLVRGVTAGARLGLGDGAGLVRASDVAVVFFTVFRILAARTRPRPPT